MEMIEKVYQIISERDENPKEGSYTNYLLGKGVDKISKKIGEEAAETIIAAKNNSKQELTAEAADLIYHLLVLLYKQGVSPADVSQELESRYNK